MQQRERNEERSEDGVLHSRSDCVVKPETAMKKEKMKAHVTLSGPKGCAWAEIEYPFTEISWQAAKMQVEQLYEDLSEPEKPLETERSLPVVHESL